MALARNKESFYNPSYEYIETTSRLGELSKYLGGQKSLAVDTETTGLNPFTSEVILLQIGTEDGKVYVIDARKVDLAPVKPILENQDIVKILAHAKFDYKMLKIAKNGAGIVLNNVFDTMLAGDVLTCGLGFSSSLSSQALKYLGAPLDKDVRKEFENFTKNDTDTFKAPFSKEQLLYAAIDAYVLHDIARAQYKDLGDNELLPTANLEFNVCIPIAEMELHGAYIDQDAWSEIIDIVGEEYNRLTKDIIKLIDPYIEQRGFFGVMDVNLDSPPQILRLFNKMGLTIGGQTIESTSKATLENINHPFARSLLEYRAFSKVLSSFGQSMLDKINPKTGRIHPEFRQIISTGRMSCSEPNLQQIPSSGKGPGAKIRDCFVAPAGKKILTADYCLAAGTLVATDRGIVPIEDVSPGDVAVQEDGTVQKIINLIDRGVQGVYKITTECGHTVKATKNHKFRVIDKNENYIWRRVGDIGPDDFMVFASDWTHNKLSNLSLPKKKYTRHGNEQNSYEYGVLNHHINLNMVEEWGMAFVKVKSLNFLGKLQTYDLEVENTHSFIADGFVSHNSQCELRILAELSQDPVFMKAYDKDLDLHADTASKIYKVNLDKVEKWMRNVSKTINFALVYGGGATTVAARTGITVDEAYEMVDTYFNVYSGIKDYLDQSGRDAVRYRYAKTILGRKRFFELPDRNHPKFKQIRSSIEREGKNHPIQGTNADITKQAMVYLYDGLKPYGGHMLFPVHDEILVEAPEENAKKAAKIQKECMEAAFVDFVKTVPNKVDVAIDDRWSKD